jgi:hypothetical protein
MTLEEAQKQIAALNEEPLVMANTHLANGTIIRPFSVTERSDEGFNINGFATDGGKEWKVSVWLGEEDLKLPNVIPMLCRALLNEMRGRLEN